MLSCRLAVAGAFCETAQGDCEEILRGSRRRSRSRIFCCGATKRRARTIAARYKRPLRASPGLSRAIINFVPDETFSCLTDASVDERFHQHQASRLPGHPFRVGCRCSKRARARSGSTPTPTSSPPATVKRTRGPDRSPTGPRVKSPTTRSARDRELRLLLSQEAATAASIQRSLLSDDADAARTGSGVSQTSTKSAGSLSDFTCARMEPYSSSSTFPGKGRGRPSDVPCSPRRACSTRRARRSADNSAQRRVHRSPRLRLVTAFIGTSTGQRPLCYVMPGTAAYVSRQSVAR